MDTDPQKPGNLWPRELAAFSHAPPSKALDTGTHEEHVRTLFRQAGFDAAEAAEYARHSAQPSDWTAAPDRHFSDGTSRRVPNDTAYSTP
jgi:hypothetical protein